MQMIASLSLAPAPDASAKALAWFDGLAAQQQWSPRLAQHLRLCLDEALTNVVQHGFALRHKHPEGAMMRIDVLKSGSEVVLDIVDNGAEFDPTRRETPPLASSLDDAQIGGQGLRLMRHYLRDIQYRREQGRNHLRLVAALDD
jgi:serine/threonine-protein kinase RsbW